MNQSTRTIIGVTLAAMMAACSPGPAETEDAQADPPMPAEPAAGAPPASAPETRPAGSTSSGSMVVYACDDGRDVTVTYEEHGALVKLPSGSTMLPRAEAGSYGDEAAYLGEELALYRTGQTVQLEMGGKSRFCSAANG